MPLVSNLAEVLHRHQAGTISQLKQDRIVRNAALNLLALISDRIQQRGEATDGRAIEGNFAANRAQGKRKGAYSVGHFYHRRKRGRQTQIMDLTLTGKTLDIDFTVLPVPKGWGIGFINDESFQRIEYLEEMFNVKIIYPNPEELQKAFLEVLKEVRNVIRTSN